MIIVNTSHLFVCYSILSIKCVQQRERVECSFQFCYSMNDEHVCGNLWFCFCFVFSFFFLCCFSFVLCIFQFDCPFILASHFSGTFHALLYSVMSGIFHFVVNSLIFSPFLYCYKKSWFQASYEYYFSVVVIVFKSISSIYYWKLNGVRSPHCHWYIQV